MMHRRSEPRVRVGDFRLPAPRWEELDAQAQDMVGANGVVIPSVRVAICWTLEYLGLRRYSDHVLVPQFVGRCVLNALNRVALPVESVTPRTRAVIAVHQFGFRQDVDRIRAQAERLSIPYVEDSPFGLETREELGRGALAKFIGFSKALPVLKGGFALFADGGLADFVRAKRGRFSSWSWPLTAALMILRAGSRAPSHSVLGELAYELYNESAGDNALLRANVSAGFKSLPRYEVNTAARLAMLRSALSESVMIPDTSRVGSFALYTAGDLNAAAAVFRRLGFDSTQYHFDVARNLFAPRYQKVLLIPLHASIEESVFLELIVALAPLAGVSTALPDPS